MSREYFDAVADQWDDLRAGFFSDALRDKALALAGLGAGASALPQAPPLTAADVGAGSGFLTDALLAAGLEVFAIDASPEMLAQLRVKFAPQLQDGRLSLLECGCHRLPLPSAGLDFVFANMLLHHAPDPAQAIGEMARVLKPGGRLVITDLDSHGHEYLLGEHHDRWPGFDRAQVAHWLAEAGLVRAGVHDVGERCCATSCACGEKAAVSIFAAVGERPVCAVPLPRADAALAQAHARACWQAERPLLCAEAVFSGVALALGVRSPLAPRVATGFCSGLSRTCGPCGAFSAGVLALGLAFGRASGGDDLDETFGPVQEYAEWFVGRFGALGCRELTGHDLGSPEGLAAYRAAGLKTSLCAPLLEQCAGQVVRVVNALGR